MLYGARVGELQRWLRQPEASVQRQLTVSSKTVLARASTCCRAWACRAIGGQRRGCRRSEGRAGGGGCRAVAAKLQARPAQLRDCYSTPCRLKSPAVRRPLPQVAGRTSSTDSTFLSAYRQTVQPIYATMQRIVLGIDGGGTTSACCALAVDGGSLLGQSVAGSSNK